MSRYAKISTFGKVSNSSQEPLLYCLNQTVNSEMNQGVNGDLFGPNSAKCQYYMAERCAENWDSACQTYYDSKQNKQDTIYPNMAQVNSCGAPGGTACNGLTSGDTLLSTAAQRRFLDYSKCGKVVEPFDPLVANSPPVTRYTCNYNFKPEVNASVIDTATLDSDRIMNLCLENPAACSDTLVKIQHHVRRNNIDLTGTKLGTFYDFVNMKAKNAIERQRATYSAPRAQRVMVPYKMLPGSCKKYSKPGASECMSVGTCSAGY